MPRKPIEPHRPLHPLVERLRQAAAGEKRLSIATRAGLSPSMVSGVFLGDRRPSVDVLAALAGALGYDVVLVKREAS